MKQLVMRMMMMIMMRMKSKMTIEEFLECKTHWLKEWQDKYRLLDIDFEMYMIMNGLSREEFDKLIKESNDKTSH
jgi:hypothetical protein